MLKEITIILLLLIMFIIIYMTFNARDFIIRRTKQADVNTMVRGLKATGYFLCVIILTMLYFLKG